MSIPLRQRIKHFSGLTSVKTETGSFTFADLDERSDRVASFLLSKKPYWKESPVTFLADPDQDYLACLLGIWKAGGIAVPLCTSHPIPELEYVLTDTESELLLYSSSFQETVGQINLPVEKIQLSNASAEKKQFPIVEPEQSALIIYTSGTTGKPKGAVSTHQSLTSQILTLSTAWHWGSDDYILNVLPLHHVHGLVNVVLCALWNGAKCFMLPKFEAEKVWALFANEPFSVFMAVPTVYSKLISFLEEKISASEREKAFKSFRLMVSGSAALPVSVLEKWQALSGHFLLERYGMTEIGMALSNLYEGKRLAGTVGFPLPGVTTQIVDEHQKISDNGDPGELWIKSPSLFRKYWKKPEATEKAFSADGWFMTGDFVKKDQEGRFTILGRNSVDILKVGGYKISALEIEEKLRQHPQIKECAVVGIPDEVYGQSVAAMIVAATKLDAETIKSWCKGQMAAYKIPHQFRQVEALPRNAMGKVVKPQVVKAFEK